MLNTTNSHKQTLLILIISLIFIIKSSTIKLSIPIRSLASKLPQDVIKTASKIDNDKITFKVSASSLINRTPTEVWISLEAKDKDKKIAIENAENLSKKIISDLAELGVNADKIAFYDSVTKIEGTAFVSKMKAKVEIFNKKETLALVKKYLMQNLRLVKIISVKNKNENQKLIKEKLTELRKKALKAARNSARNWFRKFNMPLGKLVSKKDQVDLISNLFEHGTQEQKESFSGKEELQIINLVYEFTYEEA